MSVGTSCGALVIQKYKIDNDIFLYEWPSWQSSKYLFAGCQEDTKNVLYEMQEYFNTLDFQAVAIAIVL